MTHSGIGLELWCLMPHSTIFQIYWWRKPEYPEKTTDLWADCLARNQNNVSKWSYMFANLIEVRIERITKKFSVCIFILEETWVPGENHWPVANEL
jgi:hypothetical protein